MNAWTITDPTFKCFMYIFDTAQAYPCVNGVEPYKPPEGPWEYSYDGVTYNPTVVWLCDGVTHAPTYTPTESSTYIPTESPTYTPTESPTYTPTESPTYTPVCFSLSDSVLNYFTPIISLLRGGFIKVTKNHHFAAIKGI